MYEKIVSPHIFPCATSTLYNCGTNAASHIVNEFVQKYAIEPEMKIHHFMPKALTQSKTWVYSFKKCEGTL